jgi:hypothetical protein
LYLLIDFFSDRYTLVARGVSSRRKENHHGPAA